MAQVTAARPRLLQAGEGGVVALLGVALPSHRAIHVWRRNVAVFLELWRVNLLLPVFEPAFSILVMGLGLGTYVELSGDLDYIQFLAPGILAVFPMFAGVGETLWGAYFRLERQGVYAAILATPARAEDVTTGEILWAATRTVLSAVTILLVLAVLTPFYDLIESPLALLAIPVSFLLGFMLGNLGIAYISIVTSIHQLMYFFTLVLMPMFWFGGVFFPLEDLPNWAQDVAWFIPVTHAVDIIRGLIGGQLDLGHLWDLIWLVVVAVPTYWAALWLMRRRLVR